MAIEWSQVPTLLQDPKLAEEFGKLFEGRPDVAMYTETDWTGW